MGIGSVATIMGVILAGAGWKYAYLFPYSHPMLAIRTLEKSGRNNPPGPIPQLTIDIFTSEIHVSMIIAIIVFALRYLIVLKRSVK